MRAVDENNTRINYPIDCDVVPIDSIMDGGENYRVIVAPYAQRLCALQEADTHVRFIERGRNCIRADVTNTFAKKLGANMFDGAMPLEPSGLIGPVKVRST